MDDNPLHQTMKMILSHSHPTCELHCSQMCLENSILLPALPTVRRYSIRVKRNGRHLQQAFIKVFKTKSAIMVKFLIEERQ